MCIHAPVPGLSSMGIIMSSPTIPPDIMRICPNAANPISTPLHFLDGVIMQDPHVPSSICITLQRSFKPWKGKPPASLPKAVSNPGAALHVSVVASRHGTGGGVFCEEGEDVLGGA